MSGVDPGVIGFHQIYFYILFCQLAFFILLSLFLLLLKALRLGKEKKKTELKKQITEKIQQALLEGSSTLAFTRVDPEGLSEVLEEYDKNLTGPLWEALKGTLCQTYLAKYKKRYSPKKRWSKRSLAARVFHLHAEEGDQELIRQMFQDTSFFIRTLACEAVVQLGGEKLLHATLEAMTKEPLGALYAYRTAFGRFYRPHIVVELLAIYAKLPSDDPRRRACLELFTVVPLETAPPDLSRDLNSENQNLREVAFRVLEKYVRKEDLPQLTRSLKDVSSLVRLHIARGLAALSVPEKYPLLETLLHDSVWHVRYEAGKALYASGGEGKAILAREGGTSEGPGYDVARYVLTVARLGSSL